MYISLSLYAYQPGNHSDTSHRLPGFIHFQQIDIWEKLSYALVFIISSYTQYTGPLSFLLGFFEDPYNDLVKMSLWTKSIANRNWGVYP